MMNPVFIFSLPRSGSTLLQRMLSAHPDVASVAEPWFLLPLFYSFRTKGIYTEYAQFGAHMAFEDIVKSLPNGVYDVREAVRRYAGHIYARLSEKKNARFFVDKTPRYHLIADEIIQTFPNARFIFLWRHPVSVVSSIVETWDGKYWTPFKYKVDLFKGLTSLLAAYEKYRELVLGMNYEALLQHPEKYMEEVSCYLNIDYRDEMLSKLTSVRFCGRLGDPTGVFQYQELSLDPLSKWKVTICNYHRKYWCRRYLQWIGNSRMEVMGYSLEESLKELDSLPLTTQYLWGDLLMGGYGVAYHALELRLFRDKFESETWKDVLLHG